MADIDESIEPPDTAQVDITVEQQKGAANVRLPIAESAKICVALTIVVIGAHVVSAGFYIHILSNMRHGSYTASAAERHVWEWFDYVYAYIAPFAGSIYAVWVFAVLSNLAQNRRLVRNLSPLITTALVSVPVLGWFACYLLMPQFWIAPPGPALAPTGRNPASKSRFLAILWSLKIIAYALSWLQNVGYQNVRGAGRSNYALWYWLHGVHQLMYAVSDVMLIVFINGVTTVQLSCQRRQPTV